MRETQLERISNDYSHLKSLHSQLQESYKRRGDEINRLQKVIADLRKDYTELFNKSK